MNSFGTIFLSKKSYLKKKLLFPIVTLKSYQHRKEKSYKGSTDSFGNGMTRVITWEVVEYLVVTKVFCNIALPVHPTIIRELKQDITSLTITSPSLHHHLTITSFFVCLFTLCGRACPIIH